VTAHIPKLQAIRYRKNTPSQKKDSCARKGAKSAAKKKKEEKSSKRKKNASNVARDLKIGVVVFDPDDAFFRHTDAPLEVQCAELGAMPHLQRRTGAQQESKEGV